MIVVDSSALLAILFNEARAADCQRLLEAEPDARISAGTLGETLIVAAHRNVHQAMADLVDDLGIDVASVTAATASQLAHVHLQSGKGVHPAGLNFGDCFAYALAKELDCPLLFVGDDFSRTDIKSALG